MIQSNSVTMQLDCVRTAIIPNDRFEKPVDRDDDLTQEESYVVVCVCGRNVFVWGSQLDRQDKNPSQFKNFISEIRDGQDNAVRRGISS